MRTTITLPDGLHAQLVSISQAQRQTVSRTVEVLLRRALNADRPTYRMVRNRHAGFLGADLGWPITEHDIRSLDDDE